MPKTLRKELLREIKNSRARFLSILIMVALGVMFLVGLKSAAPDMRDTADYYFDGQNFYDVQILSTLGLTEADVEAFSKVEGVETAEGGWALDAMAVLGDMQRTVKLHSISDTFDLPILIEGEMPQRAGECAVDPALMEAMGVGIGDSLTLVPAEGLEDALTEETVTITAVAESPMYISIDRGTGSLGDGTVTGFLLLPEEGFALDYYTLCNIHGTGTREMDAYGDEYENNIEQLMERLETVAEQRGDLRYETLYTDAEQELTDAEQELADAQQELADGKQELADGKQELEDAEIEAAQEIADGEQELADARIELDDGWVELADAKTEYADAVAEGERELSDARAELDDGWAQLADARDELNYAQYLLDEQIDTVTNELDVKWAELEAGEAELAAGEAELKSALAQVETLRQQVAEYAAGLEQQEAQVEQAAQNGITIDPSTLPLNRPAYEAMAAALADAEAQMAPVQAQLEAARTELEQGRAALTAAEDTAWAEFDNAQYDINMAWADYYDAKAELEQGEADYAEGKLEFETETADAWQEILDGEQELTDGETEYADGLAELEEAKAEVEQELADARQEIADAETEIADAEIEIADAETEIADAWGELEELKPADVYVLDRDTNYGFVSYAQNAQRMENLASLFPLIFFVVAALVCLTTMTRMVEEERTQIGSIKAMGYGTGTIAMKFILYGVSAALVGTVIGAAVGATLFPWVIFFSYDIMYNIPQLRLHLYWGLCFGAGGAALLSTVGATVWAMISTARQTPAVLMRPKAPKAGKRIFLERIPFLWKHLSFSVKVSCRNLFRYKKRLFMTIIGVAGCTALLMAGLGLRTNIFGIVDVQYGELFRYSAQVAVDTDEAGVQETVGNYLRSLEDVASVAAVQSKVVSCFGEENIDAYMVVTDNYDAFKEQICIRDPKTGESVEIPEEGLLIDVKMAEMLGVGPGDTITIDNGTYITVKIAGIIENYIQRFCYMSADYYESVTGETYEPNEFLLTAKEPTDEAISDLCADIMEQDGVLSAANLSASARSFAETLEVINAAVVIVVLSAAALAIVVLYNLTNINITERLRELATIKVLGFYDREVAMYVYRENAVLTLLGIGLGQLFGRYLCSFLIRTIEMDIAMFGRTPHMEDYIVSVIMSILFAVIVNVMMYFRMKKIDMVESLKSVE